MGVGQAMGPWSLQPVVQLQMDMRGEVTGTRVALKGLGTRVQAKVGLEVAGAAEALEARLTGTSTHVIPALHGAQGLSPHPHPSWTHLP